MDNEPNSSVLEYSYTEEEPVYEDSDYDSEPSLYACMIDCDLGDLLHYVTFGVGLILTVILMFMTKRKRLCPHCLYGYFALIVPVNFLEGRRKRKVIVAVCAILTLDIMDMMTESSELSKGQPRMVKIFVKVALVAAISIKYLPLLRCIHVTSMSTYVIGLLYTMLNLGTSIVDKTPNPKLPIIDTVDDLFFRIIILSVSGIYIMYWFIKRIVKLVKEGPPEEKFGKYELKYVKRLLVSQSKREADIYVHALTPKSKLQRAKGWFRTHIYHNVSGFKYSLVILVSCTVGFIGITKTATASMAEAIDVYYNLVVLLDYYSTQKALKIPNFVRWIIRYMDSAVDGAEGDSGDADEIDLNVVMRVQIIVLLIAVLLSVIAAYILSAVLICRLLVSYRDNVLNLYRRKADQAILRVTAMSNVKLVMSALQFSGYQVAYLMSGYIIQSGFLLLACIIVFEIILFPIQFAFKAFIHWLLHLVLPVLFVLIVIKGTQYLLIRFAFLKDGAKTLAIDNRRGFYITMYVVFFYNVFTGFVSCIVRVTKCALIGIIMVPRLDNSLFPRWFAKYDAGFKAYSCLLHLESLQSNPILRAFVCILLKNNVDPFSTGDDSDDRVPLTIKINRKKKNMITARNRWFVAVTLIRNPVLVYQRNLFLRVIAVQNDDAKTLTVSDDKYNERGINKATSI